MQLNVKKISVMVAMMLTITGILTSVMTLSTLPAGASFVQTWIPTWLFTAVVMAPIGMTLFIVSGKFFDRVFATVPYALRAILQGLTMALVMESLMAVSATYRLHGFIEGFGSAWVSNLLVSLPFALGISAVMALVVKPKLDAFLAA